jgi:hypothetical protein
MSEERSAAGAGASVRISISLSRASLYIRLRMRESPIFEHIKARHDLGGAAREASRQWEEPEAGADLALRRHRRQGVVWYHRQFYALFYLQTILNVHALSANYIVAIRAPARHAVLRPESPARCSLADRIGRRSGSSLAGCLDSRSVSVRPAVSMPARCSRAAGSGRLGHDGAIGRRIPGRPARACLDAADEGWNGQTAEHGPPARASRTWTCRRCWRKPGAPQRSPARRLRARCVDSRPGHGSRMAGVSRSRLPERGNLVTRALAAALSTSGNRRLAARSGVGARGPRIARTATI